MTLMMVGRLSECILLAYRSPISSVRHLVPKRLELVTRGGWAFWNIVACRIDRMRPAGLPRFVGMSYRHVAYRLYVQATTAGQQTVEGLYFVRSDADHNLMARAGNIMSDFRFHLSEIELTDNERIINLDVRNPESGIGNAHLSARFNGGPRLSEGSCFASFDEAARFLKYRPLGLSCDGEGETLKVAEVFRDESQWNEKPLSVIEAEWSVFKHLDQNDIHLEMATRVAPIDYRWRLGRREILAEF